MNIKSTSTQSNYIIEGDRNFYLINLNNGKILNKSSCFLWLKPQKALILSNKEYNLLNNSGLFKSGALIYFSLGLALIILKTLSFSLNKLMLILIAIIIPYNVEIKETK